MEDHAANSVVVKLKIDDEESINDFVTVNIISPDSTVTCGKCKKSMIFEEYESIHRGIHYNLCWLDGVEDEIDFTDSSKIQAILQENTNKCKTKLKFKCDWCKQIELTIAGFTNHLKNCTNNPLLCVKIPLESSKMNSSTSITRNDNSTVLCGRCGDNMTYTDYRNIHRYIHNNLCWLEGEDQLNYSNVDKTVALLREILPKYAERDKKVSFKCEWCDTIKKSVVGYARHVKNCAIEQEPILSQSDEPKNDNSIISDSLVNCACCEKSMLKTEYEETHKLIHYNLCWLNGEEKLDLDDENLTQRLLRKSLPKDAIKKNKVKFVCEWCQTLKKSILGFASHVKQCQLRPDKVALLNENERINNFIKSDIEITKERDASLVTCGRCNNEMTFKKYRTDHCSAHYNLCWLVGEEKLDLENFDSVLNKLKKFIPFKAVRNRLVKLTCEDCKSVKKSLSGFASHVIFCNKTANDIKLLLLKCEDCGNKIKPSSLASHKLKCKANGDDSINDSTRIEPSGSLYKMRRKRRPPNILTFHPDTKYITEYYDCVCQLCDFITSSVNDIIDHILITHDIDIKPFANEQSLDDFILITYDVHSDIYLKPLLNYYNFYKKTFWTASCHEDFYFDTSLLTSDVALKYFPSVQQSCKVFNSDGEEICVDLFKSAHINGMYWLFTGGPNWAMSWCPVPEQVKTQYLAISCHPNPDMEHKEMDIYKYPSLVQLWKFNYLDNINYESINDMPYMSYGLAHEFGAVWDMAWCPSGAYEPNKKIGLLALSTSCGDCPIFAMPHIDGNPNMFFIYKTKPMIARNFECEWIEGGVQCTKVCWQVVLPFKTLVCGYSNGNVSVFNINFQSIFLNNDILFPSHTFKAARSCITGLSMNYLNSSILATAATDGNIILWDLKSTENPVFQRKSYSPSDCNWLQQCYTLMYCSKGVYPLFLKVRTVNFSNCDDDVHDYNPDLYVLKNVSNNNKEVCTNDGEKLNRNVDETINGNKINKKNKKSTAHSDLDINSDVESFKYDESSTNSDYENSIDAMKSGDTLKNIDDEDFYGPMFLQKCTHWSVSGSDWMNVIATGDENGVIYEKLFLPEINQMKKGNSTTLQLIVRKLSNEMSESEFSNGYHFYETIKEFALESKFFPCEVDVKNKPDNSKPLLRYPLDNIIKVSWNQNFNSFRWLGIGTQSGFTLVSPSRVLPDNCFKSFYKKMSTSSCSNKTC